MTRGKAYFATFCAAVIGWCVIVFILLLAGCATLPDKEVYIAWHTPCENTTKLVRFHDTSFPLHACIVNAPPAEAIQRVLLTLLGFPVAACALTYIGTDYHEIYAAISPSVGQIINSIGTFSTPDGILEHELRHAFGSTHPELLPWLESCKHED